jgi:hypothetical protein
MVWSPRKKGYIPQGQPHKSKQAAEKDAKGFQIKESVELDEGKLRSIPISKERRKDIESGKLEVIHSIPSAESSPTYTRDPQSGEPSHFQVLRLKSGFVARKRDPFVMATVSNPKAKTPARVLGYYGSHPTSTGALKFAKNGGLIESVELDERRKDVFVIVDKKGKVVVAELTKQNADKEISRHRGGTIVLDPDAKVGDVLKTFAKEFVELDEVNTKDIKKIKLVKVPGGGYAVEVEIHQQGKIRVNRVASGMNKEMASALKDLLRKNPKLIESVELDEIIKSIKLNETPTIEQEDAEIAEPTTRFNCQSFCVDPNTYAKFSKGRRKFSRWSNYVDTSEGVGAEMYAYVKKHPTRPIVIEDEQGNCRVVKFNRRGGGGSNKLRRPRPNDEITNTINQELG